MSEYPTIVMLGAFVVVIVWYVAGKFGSRSRNRLKRISEAANPITRSGREGVSNPWSEECDLQFLGDRLGRAGFFLRKQRVLVVGSLFLTTILPTLGAGFAATLAGLSPVGALFAGGVTGYFSICGAFLFLKRRAAELDRAVMFALPLVLEGLVLVVESGLGILPAIQAMVEAERKRNGRNPVVFLLSLVYRFAASGIPISRALEMVAIGFDNKVVHHVFLHLELAAGEGNELGGSLRSLADYAHNEWKLSVETRVRRLENLVVFPVFAGLFGLVFITLAVPAVPIVEFMTKVSSSRQVEGERVPGMELKKGDR